MDRLGWNLSGMPGYSLVQTTDKIPGFALIPITAPILDHAFLDRFHSVLYAMAFISFYPTVPILVCIQGQFLVLVLIFFQERNLSQMHRKKWSIFMGYALSPDDAIFNLAMRKNSWWNKSQRNFVEQKGSLELKK